MDDQTCYLIKTNAAGLGMLADGIYALTKSGNFPEENDRIVALELAKQMRITVGGIDGNFSLELYECKQDFDAETFSAFLSASTVEDDDINQSTLDQILGAFEDERSTDEF